MLESKLHKQTIIEVVLSEKRMRAFRECLIISSKEKGFDVIDHQTAIQAVDGFKRKFFLVKSREDILFLLLERKILTEKIVLIHKNRLANFLITCPACGHKQFYDGDIVTCNNCGGRSKTPGYRT